MTRLRAGPPRRAVLLLFPVAAAACASRLEREPDVFEPLTYDYLTPILLNVAAIDIDQRLTSPQAVREEAGLGPVAPPDAVAQMARDRLRALGPSGRAVFVINEATVVRGATAYEGSLAVELDIYTSAEARAAFAEARVSGRRSLVDGESPRRASYELTKQLVDQLNVEFEFQVRRSMRDWLVQAPADAPAPAPAPVQEQPLPPPRPDQPPRSF